VGAKSRFRKSVTGGLPVLSGSSDGYGGLLFAAALAVLIVASAAVNLWSGGEGFVLLVPDGAVGRRRPLPSPTSSRRSCLACSWLMLWRARWVALGLVVLGLGHLIFGYLEPMIQADPRRRFPDLPAS
jgi:hypothetical protein